MSDELLKWLVQTGVGGVFGGWALIELRSHRRQVEDRDERLNAWLMAIHSRLSTLGAESIPPPVPELRSRRQRQRIRTVPRGFKPIEPVPEPVDDFSTEGEP